jgi:hypothetical protein
MQQTAERVAARVHPNAVTAEQAGQGVRSSIEGTITRHAADADDAYAALREFEKNAAPTTVTTTVEGRVAGGGTIPVQQSSQIQLAVDIRGTKAAMKPIYDALKREGELAPLMGGKAEAVRALDRLMSAPDFAPLSIADAALGDLKAISRGASIPALRTEGQGIAAHAVARLGDAVRKTAQDAGPKVLKALEDGRAATRAKYAAAEILDELADEPVRTAGRLTAPKDSSVSLLRKVTQVAPREIPKVGRAILDDLLAEATAEGGFSKGATIFGKWQKLGPETKKILYGEAAHDLDAFFLLAKKLSENPNPSGTALTLSKTGEVGMIVANPLLGVPMSLIATGFSKLARNPKFIRLLTKGLTLSAGNKAAATAVVAELNQIARDAGVSLVPVTADQEAGTGK